MTPGAGVLVLGPGHIIHIVKMYHFSKNNVCLFSRELIRQTKNIIMMTKEECTKIVNFICHYCEYMLSSCLSIYFTLIANVLKDYAAAFLFNCWFVFIIIMGAVDMELCAPLTRNQCKVWYSGDRKACWALVTNLSTKMLQRLWKETTS